MKINWKIINKSDNITCSKFDNKLILDINTTAWAHIYLISDTYDCQQNQRYKFSIDSESGTSDFRMLIQFYKKEALPVYESGDIPEDMYGYRCYVKNGEEVCVPDGMDCFNISVVICARESTKVCLGDIKLEHIGPYQAKNVCMCAICDNIVPKESLSSQIKITEAYCDKIDEIVAKENPDLIVLTEHFHNLGIKNLSDDEKFLTYDSEIIKMISDKAKQHSTYICGNFHILEDNCRYNRSILFDRNGENIAEYTKNHLTIMEYEMGVKPGNEISYIDTDIGRIGFITCWDMFFPEIIRMYYKKGCDILVCPTRGNAKCQNNAASYTGCAYIICSSFDAMNCIFDKAGEVVAEVNEDGYAISTVDLNKQNWRARLSVGLYYGAGENIFINEMRPETYTSLTDRV